MRTVLLLAMALTLSSCGLFNKTVTKRKLEASKSADVAVSRKSVEAASVSATELSERAKVTTVPGKSGVATTRIKNGVGIVSDSTGMLLVALIDTLSNSLQVAYSFPGGYSADYWRGTSSRDSTGAKAAEADSTDSRKEQVRSSNVDKVRRPAIGGTIAMWVGIGLMVIAAVWAIAKFVLKR